MGQPVVEPDDIYSRGVGLARDAFRSPGTTLADLARGFGRGAIQSQADIASLLSSVMGSGGMLAGVAQQLAPSPTATIPADERVRQLLAQSPLATTSDAGEFGDLLGMFAGPGPGGKIVTKAAQQETARLAEYLMSRVPRN